ncbi:Xenoxin-1 [Dissostichus eleginoides]|uniref:Xenoxin-1 n=1 Tax=Dissostichus eleginoides TaxID=100907 RepID=A0AAD9B3B2_DISEL|nr:Xenoxin-1 [Dissostichus eleginoides]
MRAAVFAILLPVIYQGEALKCNYCISKESELCTPTGTQTCSGTANACAACMNMGVCQGYISTPGAFATCCSTDLCN